MDWLTVTMLAACGGAVSMVIDLASAVHSWREDRHRARKRRAPMPPLADYLDIPADSLAFVTRVLLGAIAGLAFHNQISGIPAALAVGASAPALLRQLGSFRRVDDALDEENSQKPDPPDSLDETPPAVAGEK